MMREMLGNTFMVEHPCCEEIAALKAAVMEREERIEKLLFVIDDLSRAGAIEKAIICKKEEEIAALTA